MLYKLFMFFFLADDWLSNLTLYLKKQLQKTKIYIINMQMQTRLFGNDCSNVVIKDSWSRYVQDAVEK